MARFDDLRRALDINKHDLDEEWIRNPDLCFRISEECAIKRSERDTLKNEIEQLYAKLYREIKDGGEKLSETAIKQEITLDDRMKDKEAELIQLNEDLSRFEGLREKASQRCKALEYVTKLYERDYFVRQSGVKAREEATTTRADEGRKAAGAERRAGGLKRETRGRS